MKNIFKDFKLFSSLSKEITQGDEIDPKKDFLKASNLLKNQRELNGISRKQLALRTKVSSTVLEAIENGWTDQLPEKTFLKQMLITIEIELDLPKNSLIDILHQARSPIKTKSIKTFTASKITFFSSWEGNLVYSILILISIFALNRQQQFLSNINSLTVSPMRKYEELNNNNSIRQLTQDKKPQEVLADN
tara:strand:+ start:3786 stop:4358 length:573 start_codon:yes stop_codon:yes gene_type:complete